MKAKLLKRILFAALAGTAVFCMTACGGTNGSEGTAADPAEESTDSQETEETADTEPADSTKDDGESRVARMLTITADDMKYGRKLTDCTEFLKSVHLDSLRSSANIIGMGNTHTIERIAMIIVFEIRVSMYPSLSMRLKLSKPTHVLPVIP